MQHDSNTGIGIAEKLNSGALRPLSGPDLPRDYGIAHHARRFGIVVVAQQA
jgi:hypothetical protein